MPLYIYMQVTLWGPGVGGAACGRSGRGGAGGPGGGGNKAVAKGGRESGPSRAEPTGDTIKGAAISSLAMQVQNTSRKKGSFSRGIVRQCIRDFSKIAAPLTDLLKGTTAYIWDHNSNRPLAGSN